jgi:hypothetical protein
MKKDKSRILGDWAMEMRQRQLLAKIDQMFNLTEIEEICFHLDVDHENIVGETKTGRIKNLILYVDRRGRLDDLEGICKQLRPDNWDLEVLSHKPQKPPDAEMLSKRRSAYEALFGILKFFARYDRENEFTKAQLKEISERLRDWYFDSGGGLYLSDECRDPYFSLKDQLAKAIEEAGSEPLDPTPLINAASRLRAFMREDVK